MKPYKIIRCLKCSQFLGVKSSQKTKRCPHCGKRNVVKKLKTFKHLSFQDNVAFTIQQFTKLESAGLFERVWNP